MSDDAKKPAVKTLGQAIDAIIEALQDLDAPTRGSAIRAACDHLAVNLPSSIEPRRDQSSADALPERQEGGCVPIDIRSLKELKQPTSGSEMAALVAYYLQEVIEQSQRKKEVDFGDMELLFKQAGYPLPKATGQILFNAKAAGYFDAVGGGKFKLNPVGYNLVVHNLPRTTGEPKARRRTRKATSKGGSARKAQRKG
jgi:hypothetical protein